MKTFPSKTIITKCNQNLSDLVGDFLPVNCQSTYAFPVQSKIELTKDNAIWHEMIHLLLEEKIVREDQEWIEKLLRSISPMQPCFGRKNDFGG